jgi:hypothetical protein
MPQPYVTNITGIKPNVSPRPYSSTKFSLSMHLSQTLFASSVPEIDGNAVSDGKQWDFQSALILCKTEAGARSSMQLLLVSDQERLVSLIRTIFIFFNRGAGLCP